MLILLPPSQGQTAPSGRARTRMASFKNLQPVRDKVREALVDLCRNHPEQAAQVLGLGPSQAGEVARNAALDSAPAAAAANVYTGVLYDALRPQTLPKDALKHVVVFSGLWGMVRLDDRIPAYRCPAGINLPGVGPLGSLWRKHLGDLDGNGLLIDLRSGPYAAMAKLDAVTVKVVHDGKVVSHFNKATKGHLVRALLTSGARPGSWTELVTDLRELGFAVAGRGQSLTVEMSTDEHGMSTDGNTPSPT